MLVAPDSAARPTRLSHPGAVTRRGNGRPLNRVLVIATPAYAEKYDNAEGAVVAAEADVINLRLLGTEEQKSTVLLKKPAPEGHHFQSCPARER